MKRHAHRTTGPAIIGFLVAAAGAQAYDVIETKTGTRVPCEIIQYNEGALIFRTTNGLIRSTSLDKVQRVDFSIDEKPPARVADAKSEPDTAVRVVTREELRSRTDRGYVVLTYPVMANDSLIWVGLEVKTHYEAGRGLSRRRGAKYEPVFDTTFDRSGQMIFEVPGGRYRITLYSDPGMERRITKTQNFDVPAGTITTYSYGRRR